MHQRLTVFRDGLLDAVRSVYGPRLVSSAIFGSWARQRATPVSDIDLLVVADDLPFGRGARMVEFEPVERATFAMRRQIWGEQHPAPDLSPVIKTPPEVAAGSPLFLDMTEWCDILFDRDGFLEGYLRSLREKMRKLGCRRRAAGGGYYWEYRPGLRSGESCEL